MTAPAVIEPRPFQFFGKKWTEVTAMGRDSAAALAAHLVAQGIEFHHDPPVEPQTAVHRFLIAAAPADATQLVERALAAGRMQPAPE